MKDRFEIGTKVICIDDSPCRTCGATGPIVKGTLYVIRQLGIAGDGSPVCALVGVPTPTCHGKDTGFLITRFRSLEREKFYSEHLEVLGYLHPDEDPEHKFLRPSDLTGPDPDDP